MMPQPHTDLGCEDYFTISPKHVSTALVCPIRFN